MSGSRTHSVRFAAQCLLDESWVFHNRSIENELLGPLSGNPAIKDPGYVPYILSVIDCLLESAVFEHRYETAIDCVPSEIEI
jgi:hypothetical protein